MYIHWLYMMNRGNWSYALPVFFRFWTAGKTKQIDVVIYFYFCDQYFPHFSDILETTRKKPLVSRRVSMTNTLFNLSVLDKLNHKEQSLSPQVSYTLSLSVCGKSPVSFPSFLENSSNKTKKDFSPAPTSGSVLC